MAKDTGEIRVGANGTIRVAPTTAEEPADISAAFSDDWTDLGYANEDGVKLVDGKTLEVIKAWQLFYPARRVVTERDFMLQFNLIQFAGPQIEFGFGGGTITEDGPGKFRFTPPAPERLDERKMAVSWQDGDFNYAVIVPKGMVTENVETSFMRSKAVGLPITYGITGQDGIDPWYMLTDDPSWADAVGS